MIGILDRYFTSLLIARLLVILAGLASLVLLLDFLAHGDEVIEAAEGRPDQILQYVALRVPETLSRVLPVAVLLATLVTLTGLLRHSELTAMKSFGVSQLRMMLALAPAAALVALPQFWIEDQLLPPAVEELKTWGVGDYKHVGPKRAGGAVWARYGNDVVRFRPVGPALIAEVSIFRRDARDSLVARIDAAEAAPEGGAWMLRDVTVTRPAAQWPERLDELRWDAGRDAAALLSGSLHPREMSFANVLRFAGDPSLGSSPQYLYRFWLHKKIAVPVATVLVIFLAVPLVQGFNRRRSVALVIASGIALGFVYFSFDGLVLTLGEAGLLPPGVAAWAPTAAFAAIAASIALQHESL